MQKLDTSFKVCILHISVPRSVGINDVGYDRMPFVASVVCGTVHERRNTARDIAQRAFSAYGRFEPHFSFGLAIVLVHPADK